MEARSIRLETWLEPSVVMKLEKLRSEAIKFFPYKNLSMSSLLREALIAYLNVTTPRDAQKPIKIVGLKCCCCGGSGTGPADEPYDDLNTYTCLFCIIKREEEKAKHPPEDLHAGPPEASHRGDGPHPESSGGIGA